MPGISALHCQHADDQRVARRQRGERAVAEPAQLLAEQQQQPVHHQEAGRHQRRGEQAADEFFQREAHDHRRNGGDDDQHQRQPGVVHRWLLPKPSAPRASPHQSRQKYSDQRRRRAGVQHHQERQERGRMLVEVPVQQRRQHHRMAQAADREQLGRPLQNGHRDGLDRIHVALAPWLSSRAQEWRIGGALQPSRQAPVGAGASSTVNPASVIAASSAPAVAPETISTMWRSRSATSVAAGSTVCTARVMLPDAALAAHVGNGEAGHAGLPAWSAKAASRQGSRPGPGRQRGPTLAAAPTNV